MITQGENNVLLPLSLGVDLTGATVEVVFKRGFYSFKKTATISDVLKGLAAVTFFSNDFRDWGRWKYQVSIIKGTSEVKLDQEILQVYQGVGEIVEPPDQTDPPPAEGSGLLTFANLAELQGAYPNGSNQPIWISGENAWYYWEGEVVEPEPDTTAPNNVTNLVATPSQTSVSLSWMGSTSSDVASYEVWRGSTLVTTVTGTSFNVTGLTASTAYTFTVKSKDSNGNISSGVSVSSTTTSEPVTDTTAPVLTITPAGTFTDTKQVTMSTNETASIWYTLDDSDPKTSGTKIQYTAPITLTATDTIKVYAKDTANNESAVQTVTYTKEASGSFATILDSFNRADSTTLGTTDTGQTWVQHTDVTYGISGNQAYQSVQVSGGVPRYRKIPYITVPSNNFAVEVTFATIDPASSNVSLHVRYTSSTSTVMVFITGNKYNIAKFGSSGYSLMKTGTKVPVNGDRLRVEHKADGTIDLYVNGVLDATHLDTEFLSTSHKVGFGAETAVSRFEDFRIEPLT